MSAVVSLPSLAARSAIARDLHAALDQALAPVPGPLAWCLRPVLVDNLVTRPRRASRPVRARHLVGGLRLRSSPRFTSQGPLLFATDTQNQRRVLSPLMQSGEDPHSEVSSGPALIGTRATRDTAQAIVNACRVVDVPVDEDVATELALGAARALRRAQIVLGRAKPRAVVVATQHGPSIRALLHTAHLQGLSTVYLPHAPVARLPTYADLPVTFAALRGPEEVAFYERLGASPRAALRAVGNPAVDLLESPLAPREGPIVLALSPDPIDQLAAVVDVVSAAVGDRHVVVAPHPRSDVQSLATLVPAAWGLWQKGDTLGCLRAGAHAVLVASSGVAWEAKALGLPVVQLQFPGVEPDYPLLDAELTPHASTNQELKAVLDALDVRSPPSDHLREQARDWCVADGVAAAARAHSVLEEAVRATGRGVLLDGWAHGSAWRSFS